jgi:hypothetical protein
MGTAYLPAKYTEAASVGDRMDLMDAIDVLTSEELEAMMDATTREKIREFVLAGREAAAKTPGNLEPAHVVELPSAKSTEQTVVEPAPTEALVEGDVGSAQSGGA